MFLIGWAPHVRFAVRDLFTDGTMEKSGFSWACKTGDMKGVTEAVNAGEDVNQVDGTVNGRTPLHYAADFGQVEVISFLIAKGAKVDAADRFGITPLLAAVYEGHAEAVAALISAGADKSITGPDGKTALEAAESDAVKAALQ